MKRFLKCLAFLLAPALPLLLAAKDPGAVVDSGTFQIVVNGQQVGTETFKIQQQAGRSITTSSIKVQSGGTKAEQSSVLEMTAAGELIGYSWKEQSPGKAQTTVDVTSGALLQRVVAGEKAKPIEVPYMAAPTTFILDDNFFTHRQLLVWRYLAGSCGQKDGKPACNPTKLGVLVPAQHVMIVVNLELVGPEKLNWRGAERDMLHVRMTAEEVGWDIWVDPADNYKMVRVLVPANKTEVLRD